MTKTKSNTDIFPIITALSRRGMTHLMVKVVVMAFLDLDEARKVLKVAVGYQMGIIWDISSPSTTNLIKEGLYNYTAGLFGVIQIMRVFHTVSATTM